MPAVAPVVSTNTPAKPKIGRPSEYTLAKAERICDAIADGATILQVIARDDMPAWCTIRRWLLQNTEFQTLYARAHEWLAERQFAELDELERQVLAGTVDPQAARVVIDSRKWRLAKMRPKVYGDHSSKTVTVQPGEGYAALLEEIDSRRMIEGKVKDITPKEGE